MFETMSAAHATMSTAKPHASPTWSSRARQSPRAARGEHERRRGADAVQRREAPRDRHHRGGDAERDDVRERVELAAELARRVHGARDVAVELVEDRREDHEERALRGTPV